MRRLLFGLAIASIAALSPCWVHADDQQVAQQIVEQLRQRKADGQLKDFGIDLEVDKGIVWLKGHVRSREQQGLVLDIARRVDGVQQVINDIRIQAAPSPETKSRVRPALLKTENNDDGLLEKPGKLLSNLHESMQRALSPTGSDTRQTPTVAKKPTPPPPAEKPKGLLTSLRSSVQQAFRPAVTRDVQPTTSPEIKRPTASPQMTESPQIAKTERAKPQPTPARPEPVQRPVASANRPSRTAHVPPSQPRQVTPSDEQLAEEIIGKLRVQKDRGILQDFDIDIQVNDRVVWVAGHVASDSQRNLVLDVSRRVRGVDKVVNDLDIGSGTPAQMVSTAQASPAPISEEPAPTPAPQPAEPAQTAGAPAPFQYTPGQPINGRGQVPVAYAPAQSAVYRQQFVGQPVAEVPAARGVARARFDHPTMPGYAWPSYAAYPNYGAVTYPRQYSPTAWPYIGPFYPYPQVPLGWRKVTLEWDDGWWMLDFKSK